MRTISTFSFVLALAAGCALDEAGEVSESTTEQGLHIASWTIWGSPIIPVCFDNGGTAEERRWVQEALRDTWEAVSSVRFINWNNCSVFNSGVRVRMSDSRGYAVTLGKGLDGVALGVNLSTFASMPGGCGSGLTREDCVRAVAVHEFGHVLGFAHEQARADTPGTCTQGDSPEFLGDRSVGPWDEESVMNYCNPKWNNHGFLSRIDIAGVRAYYGTNGRLTDPHLFDPAFYVAANPGLPIIFQWDHEAATQHWLATGLPFEARRASRTFDVQYYANQNADLRAAFGSTNYRAMIRHWAEAGLTEGRRGSREFDVTFYLRRYPDVAALTGGDHALARLHWVSEGLPVEGRRGSREVDMQFYRAAYPDIAAAFGVDYESMLDHFIVQGLPNEARRGSRELDVAFYRAAYSDASVLTPERAMNHFIAVGLPAGRRGSLEVDVAYYTARYPDLAAAYGTNRLAALDHWILYGLPNEGRRGSAAFDVGFYRAWYSDVAPLGNEGAFDHWVRTGRAEGRLGVFTPISPRPRW